MKHMYPLFVCTCMLLINQAKAQNNEIESAKERITFLLEDNGSFWEPDNTTGNYPYTVFKIKKASVYEDKIVLIVNESINKKNKNYYSDVDQTKVINLAGIYKYTNTNFVDIDHYQLVKKIADDYKDVKELDKCIMLLRNNIFNAELEQFNQIATEYRGMAEKPSITEEQRRYIVQANLMNQQKNFEKSMELYNRALDINPSSYPAAYYNLALLSAYVKKFDEAIIQMKKYLMLVPDAQDARSAQDKIYEWEIQK